MFEHQKTGRIGCILDFQFFNFVSLLKGHAESLQS